MNMIARTCIVPKLKTVSFNFDQRFKFGVVRRDDR
jgi:hypothetical protein